MAVPASRSRMIEYLSELEKHSSSWKNLLISNKYKGDLIFEDVSEDIEYLERIINLLKTEANLK